MAMAMAMAIAIAYIGIIAFLHKAVQTVDNEVLPPSLMVFCAINFIIIVCVYPALLRLQQRQLHHHSLYHAH